MAVVALLSKNILESSSVSLSSGIEEPLQPLSRIYDRDIGLVFKVTTATTTVVHVDQGATDILAIDTLIIASGHNLAAVTLDMEYSDDNAAWTPATPQWTGTAGTIKKTWASETHRYWRFTATTPASAVEMTELFLSPTYTWEANPVTPVAAPLEPGFNVKETFTSAGKPMYFVAGAQKRARNYKINSVLAAQKANLLLFWDDWSGYKPFWIADHLGELFFARMAAPLNISQNHASASFSADFKVEEVLGS